MSRKGLAKLLLVHLQVVAGVAVPDLVLLSNVLTTVDAAVLSELEVLTNGFWLCSITCHVVAPIPLPSLASSFLAIYRNHHVLVQVRQPLQFQSGLLSCSRVHVRGEWRVSPRT